MKDPMPAPDDDQMMQAFAELASLVVDANPPEQTLRRVAELAKQTLPEVEDLSLTLIENGHPKTVVFTGPLAVDLDERQYELGFGPCLDAAKSGQTIVVDHHDEDSPYREFARLALRAGVRQTVSVGMPINQRSIGGLNIYRTTEEAVPHPFLERAEMFAGYAAVAVNNVTSYASAVDEAGHLRIALEARATIDQAKGMIMARERCTPDEAFDILRRVSQNQNIKLRELARSIVDEAQKK